MKKLVFALLLMASTIWAAPILYIDTFDVTAQRCLFDDAACLAPGITETVAPNEAISPTRFMQLSDLNGEVTARVTPRTGLLSFNQELGSSAVLSVLWASTVGGPLDLTAAGRGRGFEMRAHSDLGMSGTLSVTDAAGTTSVSFSIPRLDLGVYDVVSIPFSAFAGTDLANVTRVTLTLNGTGRPEADAGLDYLGVTAPEPGSMALIGAGLLGLGLLRKRARKA